MSTHNEILVFSVFRPEDPSNNSKRHSYVRNNLRDRKIASKELRGTYKGVEEDSFLLNYSEENRDLMLVYLDLFCQESYLFQNKEGIVMLVFVDKDRPGEEVPLGRFTFSREKPDVLDWLYDEKEKYYHWVKEGYYEAD